MSAWRPYSNLICGELDNTKPGKVTGWLRFAGIEDKVVLDLEGDFHRDIRGTSVKLTNPEVANATPEYMEGFARLQTGQVGDMTAGREPVDYVDYPYFEWYADNGRVVLELEPHQVEIVGTPRPWKEETPVSRAEQAANLGKFMAGMVNALAARREPEGDSQAAEPSAGSDTYKQYHAHLTELLAGEKYRRYGSEVYMPLTVERLEGVPMISLSHTGMQHGDVMRDPEICFLVEEQGARPVYYRNDYLGLEHATVPDHFGDVSVQPHLQAQLDSFTSSWFEMLRERGFFTQAQARNEAASQLDQPALYPTTTSPANEAAMNKAEPNEVTSLPGMTVAAPRGAVAPDASHNEEIVMAGTREFEELCAFDSGRFTASVSGRHNRESQTYTYAANVQCDGRRLFDMQLKHELAGLGRVAGEGGEEWLTRRLFARDVPDRIATTRDVQDFQTAVRTSEQLIGRFAERGHEAVLKDAAVLEELDLQSREELAQETRTISRER